MPDFYETLGVSKTATADEIKSAYRKLAMKYHPDRDGGDAEKFKNINVAYETLSDPQKRNIYDRGGQNQHFDFSNFGAHGFHFNFDGEDLEEILGNHFNFGRRQRRSKNKDLLITVPISLKDSLQSKKMVLQYKTTRNPNNTIEIDTPDSILYSSRIRYAGLGDDSLTGVPRGDLLIDFNLVLPPNYWMEPNYTICTFIKIPVWDALIGTTYKFKSFDDKEYDVKIPPGTQPNTRLILKKIGLNLHKNRGNLALRIEIDMPAITKDEQIKLMNAIVELQNSSE